MAMPFISQPLDMPHCHWRIFENQCIGIKNNDDWYKAELLESGLWLCIQKNGKSRKNAQGKFPNDFIVRIYDIEKGQYICQPHYTRSNGDPRRYKGLIPDLYDKLITDRQSTELLIDVLNTGCP